MERPQKRARLLSDASSASSDSDSASQTAASSNVLKINKEYAKRFEHNKQREERHRLEEKLKDEPTDSSSDESEDDDADLVTPDLDQEIMTTLQAIKAKDPRVYDQASTFYRAIDDAAVAGQQSKQKSEAPMTLSDYHRENILAGYTGAPDEQDTPSNAPQTYQQEQDQLRRSVVSQFHAAAAGEDEDDDNSSGSGDSEDDSGFKVKRNGVHEKVGAVPAKKITSADVAGADNDPETYLSNFMAAQAWRPTAGQTAMPFDSDDSEDDARADAFEEAYNMRFEDPATANEKLKSFARDSGQYSVRREATGARKRAREREKEAKQEAKQEREKEKDRLRKLKLNEMEEKLKAIRHAAGLAGKDVDVQDWRQVLEGDFDDDSWDKEMRQRFGDHYYSAADADALSESGEKKKRRPKKPTWTDDIDVADILSEHEVDDHGGFTLSDDDTKVNDDASVSQKRGSQPDDAQAAKRAHKRDRRIIEQMVEASLPVASVKQGGFRYRDTSPVSFGMHAQDILLASDAQLNQFAGLKKLAPFRDEARKAKDKKRLGKKARLREWRKEVFGKEELAPLGIPESNGVDTDAVPASQVTEVKTNKKRKRKNKAKSSA